MQVTETLSEGLKREFNVVVPAAELDAKVNERLDELKGRIRIDGFRPGKVPVSHLKRVYGRSAMAEVIEATVRNANNQIVSERGYKLAAEPKVTLPEEKDAIEQLIAGKSDLNYTMAVEIVPPIELTDFKAIKLTRLTSDVADAEIEEAVARIAEQSKPYTTRPAGEKAASGDRVVISFAGTIDGKPFEGGTGGRGVSRRRTGARRHSADLRHHQPPPGRQPRVGPGGLGLGHGRNLCDHDGRRRSLARRRGARGGLPRVPGRGRARLRHRVAPGGGPRRRIANLPHVGRRGHVDPPVH